jgi:tetratricopeptide (TPR) repeat protein
MTERIVEISFPIKENILLSVKETKADNVITLTSYANLLAKQGELEETIHIFNKAVNLRPNDIVTLTSYANILAQSGQNEKALQIFEQALNLDRSDTRTISHFTDALLQAESWARLVELRPDYAYARLKYAQALESEGQYQAALAQL